MTFGYRLKEEIKRQGMTQNEVGLKAGLGENTIKHYIANNQLPRVDNAVAIAQVLGTTVEWLMTGECPIRLEKHEIKILVDKFEKYLLAGEYWKDF